MATNWEKVFVGDHQTVSGEMLSPEHLEEFEDDAETEYLEQLSSGEILPSERLGLIPEQMKPVPRRAEKAPTLRDLGNSQDAMGVVS